MKERLEKMNQWFQEKSKELGVDFFPINWEVVPEEVILEIASYGLPKKFSHWSYGQSYQYQKMQGQLGLSKIYELILNSEPSYAFLLESNSDVANIMIIAHCIFHSAFFKNNYLFKQTDRQMIFHAAERAQRIDDYIAQYGIEKVEHVLDIALSMDKNIDWNRGANRKPYPPKEKRLVKRPVSEFGDLYKEEEKYEEVILNGEFPPHKEYDILWFLANYANLENWKRDIFEIVREESYYFYPQYLTKIANEGFASFGHAELMYLLKDDLLSPEEYLEFVKVHEKVVQPGANKLDINPYFLGFTIFNDVRKRWDQKFEEGTSDLTGIQKICQIVQEEDDISFLRNYLTQELVDEMKMFTYKTEYDRNQNQYIEIESTQVKDVVEAQISKIYHYRTPLIYIEKASPAGLELVHESTNIGTLDPKHLEKVCGYLHEIWGGIIDIKSIDDDGKELHFTYDEEGFSHPS